MFAAIKSLIPEPRLTDQPRRYVGRHRQIDDAPQVNRPPMPLALPPAPPALSPESPSPPAALPQVESVLVVAEPATLTATTDETAAA